MKYVIDIPDNVKKIVYFHLGNANAVWTTSNVLDDLEQLNSDYINEHFGQLQDDAYDEGYAQCRNDYGDAIKHAKDTAYQRGLNDAWEAARKIVTWPDRSLVNSDTFDLDPGESIFTKYSASEAIEKLKAYEEKQEAADEIKVGDIVERYIDGKFDSKGIYLNDADEKGAYWNCLFWTGACFVTLGYPKNQFKKTDRHFDIDKILEEMKHD